METTLGAAGVKDPAAAAAALAGQDIDWELLNSSYEWPCPECVKNGVRMHQRKQVTPGTTVATGRKRRRGDMGGWK